MITKYHSFTDEEFLRIVRDARRASPIIAELCTRLEGRTQLGDDQRIVRLKDTAFRCPHCEADLLVDDEDGKLNLV